MSYPVLDLVSQAYPRTKGRLLTCYSPVRRSSTPKGLSARLACVKHAASVRPEPGSNSPLRPNDNHPKKAAAAKPRESKPSNNQALPERRTKRIASKKSLTEPPKTEIQA